MPAVIVSIAECLQHACSAVQCTSREQMRWTRMNMHMHMHMNMNMHMHMHMHMHMYMHMNMTCSAAVS